MTITHDFAILAPIPEIHLISGWETLETKRSQGDANPRVAYGSDAYEVFVKANELRKSQQVAVFVYASQAQGDQPLNHQVSWRALLVHSAESRRGRYAGKTAIRPPSTITDTAWAWFWEVTDLELLKKPIPIGSLRGLRQKAVYKPRFIPECPLLIEYPRI